VTRQDLALGYQAVQPSHALATFAIEHHQIFTNWQHNHKNLIILSVKDEKALHDLLLRAKIKDIKVSFFREPDIKDALTAIALEPCEDTYSLTGNLNLALKKAG
ncbi:MAG: hypothetical protein DRQ44_16510, partial [Gammaproteobacteria bacterium]